MNVSVEDVGPCRKRLRIELPAERVQKEYAGRLDRYTALAELPGFRKGRAPRAVVERRFSRNLADETREQLIREGYREAVEQTKLDVVALVDVESVAFDVGHPLSFGALVDVPPVFELPTYKGIPLTGQPTVVSDTQVEEAIAQIRERSASFEVMTGRPVQKGDLVQVDFDAVCDGRPLADIAPKAAGLGQARDYWIRADERAFLPELGDALIGTSVGDQKEVGVDFAQDFSVSELAGKHAVYTVSTKAVREPKLPELDESFLKGLGVESVEQLHERVRESLQQTADAAEQRQRRDQVVRYLLEKTQIDVPESLVQAQTRSAVYDMVRHNRMRGISREEIESHRDDIFGAAAQSAVETVKLRHILRRVATEESLKASEEDVTAEIQRLAAETGVTPEQVRSDLEQHELLDDLSDDLRRRKALEWLLQQAEVRVEEGAAT